VSSNRAAAGGASVVSTEPTRRRLTDRQADTVQRLVDAVVSEVRRHGYEATTVRGVARRAGVAPATAYTYFASKDHLFAEVWWRRLRALPHATDPTTVIRDICLLVADEPELSAACTTAMLAGDPDVAHLRERVGLEIRVRLSDALGPKANPVALRALEYALSGALLQAGMGHLDYADLATDLGDVTALVLRGRR
jgi:AcrR family transcriptional regulator